MYAGEGKGNKGAKDVAGREEKSDIYKLVKMVMERGYDPASSVLPRLTVDDVCVMVGCLSQRLRASG